MDISWPRGEQSNYCPEVVEISWKMGPGTAIPKVAIKKLFCYPIVLITETLSIVRLVVDVWHSTMFDVIYALYQ